MGGLLVLIGVEISVIVYLLYLDAFFFRKIGDGFGLLLPKRLARSGVSLSIELNIHDRKRSNGL